MMYRLSFIASSLLATLPFTALAQQAPAPAAASSAAAAPGAITIMPGPPGNAGNAGAATSAAAAPGVSSVTMGLGAGAGVGAGNLSSSVAASAAAPANTAGVIGGQVAVWVVKVGSANNDLIFSPNSVSAKVGEMVQFQFYSKNHSVASGDFAAPCTPQQPATNAFFSGFMPTDKQGQLTYTIPIRDTNPIWFYCSQGKHCQEGMVGVINPPASGQTLADYQARAATAPNNVSPNAPAAPAGGAGQIGGTSGTPAAAPAPATTKKNAASKMVGSSWSILGVAVAAWLLL